MLISAEESGRRSSQKSRYHREAPDVLRERISNYKSLGTALGVRFLDAAATSEQLAATIRASMLTFHELDQVTGGS